MNRHKCRTANGLFEGPDNIHLRSMFWNADGLTNVKFTELKTFITTNDIDIYGIAEAGAATDNIQFFQIPGYQTYILKRERQVASGIVVAAKTTLVVDFKVRKAMTDDDKLEMVELEVWKQNIHSRLLFAYNPPRNVPNLTWLETTWDSKCILIGDLNAPSIRWAYRNTDSVGRCWEDFIDSNAALFIENEAREPTFLAYNGSTSHPDLVVAHSSLVPNIKHVLAAAPGGFGHKILMIDLLLGGGSPIKEHRRPRWNLKKANWIKYKQVTDEAITEDLIDNRVDQSLKRLQKRIVKCAHQCIPRGQMKRYKPFWNQELQAMKEDRDHTRREAESLPTAAIFQVLKEKNAALKRKILEAKRASYREFLENLDYRKDGIIAHRFISKLNGEKEPPNNPIAAPGRMLTSENEIAKYFCSYYSKIGNYRPRKENGKPQIRPSPTCLSEEEDLLCNKELLLEELDMALSDTPKEKSAGPDDILPEFPIYLGPQAKKNCAKTPKSYMVQSLPSRMEESRNSAHSQKEKSCGSTREL